MDTPNLILASLPSEVQFLAAASEPLELEAEEAPAEGQPAKLRKFSMTAYTGVAMKLGGFPHAVVADLEGMTVPSQSIPILAGHDHTQIVGHTTKVDKSAQRIKAGGLVSGTGDAAKQVLSLAANGFPWGASIGASIEKLEFLPAGESATVNARKVTGPVYIARKSTLREISTTPVGADASASTSVAASASKGTTQMNKFQKWLLASGFVEAELTDEQKTALKAAFDASEKASEKPAHSDLDSVMASRRAEQERRSGVADLVMNATENRPDFLADAERIGNLAIQGGWDLNRTELELLRASRVTLDVRGFAGSNGRDDKNTPLVVEAAFARASGAVSEERLLKQYGEQTLEASHARHKAGVSIGELLFMAAQQRGYRGSPRDFKAMIKAAYSPEVRANAQASTIDVSGLLGNVANVTAKDAYNHVEQEWRKVSARRSVNDFKEHTQYSLTGDIEFKKVAPGGPITHGSLSEDSVGNKVDTYARMLGLSYQDLRNDSTGSFTQLNKKIGRGGALAINRDFWSEFLDNADFFKTANGNYDSGNDTLMDLTGMANAVALFETQTDPDGNPMGVEPKIVAVPPALYPAAWTLLNSDKLNLSTSTAASTGDRSPWAGMFQLVKSAYLQNANLGGSSKSWYLLADPLDVPVIEMAFLDGVELPQIDVSDWDFDSLGLQMRGSFHYGVRKQHSRGGVKMAGQ